MYQVHEDLEAEQLGLTTDWEIRWVWIESHDVITNLIST